MNEPPLILTVVVSGIINKIGIVTYMSLADLLLENKLKIVSTWIDRVMRTYSTDGARFFKNQKDRFANPLGYNVEKGLENLFESLLGGEEIEELPKELFQFIKLRAVQDMSPSEALAFLYELKAVVRSTCGGKALLEVADEWLEFDAVIDRVALIGFDLYVKDRELLYQVKYNELKRGNNVMLERGIPCPSAVMKENKDVKKELKVLQDC